MTWHKEIAFFPIRRTLLKKVLLFHNILWSHYKGSVFSELYKLLEKNKIQFNVAHIALRGKAQASFGNVNPIDHQYPYKVLFKNDYENVGCMRKAFAMCREIIQYKPSVVILPGFNELSFWAALLMANLLMIPVIVTCDSTAMDRPKVWYKDLLKRMFIKKCSAAFGYGVKSQEYLLQLGMAASGIFIRCQATNNKEIAALHRHFSRSRRTICVQNGFKPYNFIYVGRLSLEKNVRSLVKAFSIVKQKELISQDWGLLIVGDGRQRKALTKLCIDLSINTDVNFVGGKTWREVPKYYALSDVHVLPSMSEPWGLVVNEAMVCGLPILVSDRCGATYDLLRDGYNGFVFSPDNVNELAEKMIYMILHSEERIKMGRRSAEIISEFTPENVARQMFAGINKVLLG